MADQRQISRTDCRGPRTFGIVETPVTNTQKGKYSSIVPLDTGHTRGSNRQIYNPEFCQTVRDLAQQGLFPESWCAHIGVTMRTMFTWADRYPEFCEAFEIGWHLLADYWSKEALNSIQGVGRPPSVTLEILRKRFPATYGSKPRNTLETFMHRNQPDRADLEQQTMNITRLSDEDLSRKIAILEERRYHLTSTN